MKLSLTFSLPPQAKARPRVTKRGTYMPPAYMLWRKAFCYQASTQSAAGLFLAGDVSVLTVFTTKTGNCRADLDNAHAACLDALQDAGVILNDKQVRAGTYLIRKGKENVIEIIVETLEDLP